MKTNYNIFAYLLILFIGIQILPQTAHSEDPVKYVNTAYMETLFSEVDIEDARAAIEIWSNNLQHRLASVQIIPRSAIFRSLDKISKAIKNNELDMINIPPLDYIQLRKKVKLNPALVTLPNNKSQEQYVLLVPTNKNINSLKQLKNKKLYIDLSGRDSIALIWLDTLLLKENLSESNSFFYSIKRVDNSSKAVLPVFFQQADACIVTQTAFETISELNSQIGKTLKPLYISPGFVRALICFNANYSKVYARLIINSCLSLQSEPEGRQLLMLFNLSRLVPFEPKHLQSVENLIIEYNNLKARQK